METEYRRCQGKSYMVLHVKTDAKGYEYPMLSKNRIAGLLPVQAACADGQTQFWYEISGMQALEEKVKIKKPGRDFLRTFLSALSLAVRQSGEYLLHEDGISLEPGHIFIDSRDREMQFCYLPFKKKDFAESLREFMEYYIAQMEHGDKEGARQCYEAYEASRQANVPLEQLLQIMYEEEKDVLREARREENEPGDEEEPVVLGGALDAQKNKREGLCQRFNGWRRWMAPAKKRAAPGPYAFEPEECVEEPLRPTVFLGSETERVIGELRYEGDGNAKNLRITSAAYLIGSRAKDADGVIADDAVSRIHAKITKEGEDYYLEDMNSTNGTYHNGELLNYKDKALLAKNDRVSFANERYRFV